MQRSRHFSESVTMNAICESSTVLNLWLAITVGLIVAGLLGLLLEVDRTPGPRHRSGSPIVLKIKEFAYLGSSASLLFIGGIALFLAALYALRACSPQPAAGQSFINNGVLNIHQTLNQGVDSAAYSIRHVPDSALVDGREGDYYTIDLRDPVTGDSIFFDLGKYTVDLLSSSFRRSWERVRHDILSRLDADSVRYQLFVVGSADTIGAQVENLGLLMGNVPRHVMYYPRDPQDPIRFLPEPTSQLIPVEYNNRHLPNLRAAFVQERLKHDGKEDSIILDGAIHASSDGSDRNAVIVLYWPRDYREASAPRR